MTEWNVQKDGVGDSSLTLRMTEWRGFFADAQNDGIGGGMTEWAFWRIKKGGFLTRLYVRQTR